MPDGPSYRFAWVAEGDPVLGGQWVSVSPDEAADVEPEPAVLADAVAAFRGGWLKTDPLAAHVDAVFLVVGAAGALEDDLLPGSAERLTASLASATTGEPEIDPASPEGERVRRAADALEKLAADLAELVEEQLGDGSLARLPPESTRALCLAVQTAWRLRTRVSPPGPLYL